MKPVIRYAHNYWWCGTPSLMYYTYAMAGRDPLDAYNSWRLRKHRDFLLYGDLR